MKRRTIAGQDHWQYAARISHAPATGRPVLEVIQDEDEVLLKDGDEFCTFWAAQQLPTVLPEWPSDEPTAEAVELAQQIAAEGPAAVSALARANRINRKLQEAGLDPDHPLVRLAAAATLSAIAEELEEGDDDA